MMRLELTDFVTRNAESYVSKARELTSDLSKLSEIRGNMRSSAENNIFNAKPYVAELERASRDIWKKYCQKTESDNPKL